MDVKKLQRGKIKTPPAPEIIRYVIAPAIEEDSKTAFREYLEINKAHVLMLLKQGIIPKEEAQAILRVNAEMEDMGESTAFPLDPKKEELYFNLEGYLISKVGMEIGGKQHTARSRNDLIATASRLVARKYYFKACSHFNGLREQMLELAKISQDAVFSGHTHLQPSEPITFAHYLSAVLSGLERDYARLSEAFSRLNICPLGGTSMGSSTFPIDRTLTSQLLGFNLPINNSLDCVASRDYVLEILSDLAIAGNTVTRFANDLYIWATPLYGYVEIDDSAAACSSIMPQKKNPWTLEYIKGRSAKLEGALTTALSALRSSYYTHSQDVSYESYSVLIPAFETFIAMVELMRATLRGIKLNREKMLRDARANFCTATELANTLVRKDGISFREAHKIVAAVVSAMNEQNKVSTDIRLELVSEVVQAFLGKGTGLSAEDLETALDPVKNVASKVILGGTSTSEIERQLAELAHRLTADAALLSSREESVQSAGAELNRYVNTLLEN